MSAPDAMPEGTPDDTPDAGGEGRGRLTVTAGGSGPPKPRRQRPAPADIQKRSDVELEAALRVSLERLTSLRAEHAPAHIIATERRLISLGATEWLRRFPLPARPPKPREVRVTLTVRVQRVDLEWVTVQFEDATRRLGDVTPTERIRYRDAEAALRRALSGEARYDVAAGLWRVPYGRAIRRWIQATRGTAGVEVIHGPGAGALGPDFRPESASTGGPTTTHESDPEREEER